MTLSKTVKYCLLGLLAVATLIGARTALIADANAVGNEGINYNAPAISLADGQRLHVYYFHGNARCTTCKLMERYTVTGAQQGYGKEIGAGQLELHLVNVELAENEHFVKDFELITRTVVLALEDNGEIVLFRRLDDVWNAVASEQKFTDYLYREIGKMAPKAS